MRVFLAVAAILIGVCGTPAAAQKCDLGSARKPLLGESFQLPDGTRFREAYVRISCTSQGRAWAGLADASGKLLIPAQYHSVTVLTRTLAAVQRPDKARSLQDWRGFPYHLYEIGKGERKEALSWAQLSTFDWNGMRTPFAWGDAARPNEVALILGDLANPARIANLGGKGWPADASWLYQVKGTLIANFTAPDGTALSRVLNMRGEPVSPAIGAIERWETISPEQGRTLWQWRRNGRYDYPVLAVDYLSAILTGDHAVLPYGKLYQPIGPGGEPLPLPAGAIGVFPLRLDTHPWSGSTTQGWAIVEETPQGLRVRPGLGTLQSVLARAGTLPVYTGLARHIERSGSDDTQRWVDVFAVRAAGDPLWRIIDAQTLGKSSADPAGSTGVNARDALGNLAADREAARRNFAAQRERDRLAATQRSNKELEDRHQWLLSSGRICEWSPGGELRGAKTVNYMLANCPIASDAFFNYARSTGGDPGLISKAEFAYWEKRGRYAAPVPAAPRDIYATPNWAAWGDAIVKSARESTDTFIRDRKREYYRNMEDWNRGKQNWCC
ncbi:hypothetical protein ACFQ1E_05500 [Sphingomonas canadensis]|uniref:Uncharacterized protein n=1 Tax=Sphingomonas canadensis TaxID=1219257 RepID=A0ABW3H8R5_9SPHN|nr:hypothetical protein [Sphingomonas canadensis]MCW3835756.1 hypothetical protein [Sphingomonas canadensis]